MKIYEHKDEYAAALRVFSYSPKEDHLWVSAESHLGDVTLDVKLTHAAAARLVEVLTKLLLRKDE